MSTLVEDADNDAFVGVAGESLAELERRHKAEIRKLEGEVRALLKTAKKSTRDQVETQALRMQYDLKERHQEELDNLESKPGNVIIVTQHGCNCYWSPNITASSDSAEPIGEMILNEEDNIQVEKLAEDIASAKRAKSKKKQVRSLVSQHLRAVDLVSHYLPG